MSDEKKVPKKEIKQIVQVDPSKIEKPSAMRAVSDDLKEVGGSLLDNVIKPAFNDMIYDFITRGAGMMIYHDDDDRDYGRGHSRRSYGGNASYYTAYDRDDDRPSRRRGRSRGRGLLVDIPIESRRDAQDVLKELNRYLDHYHFVSVADYYETVGYQADNPTQANAYGWDDLDEAYIERRRDGRFEIIFPKPIPFD